jgi:hypothetical protein
MHVQQAMELAGSSASSDETCAITLRDSYECQYIDACWMLDGDVRTQLEHAHDSFYDGVLSGLVESAGAPGVSVRVSDEMANRITGLLVKVRAAGPGLLASRASSAADGKGGVLSGRARITAGAAEEAW